MSLKDNPNVEEGLGCVLYALAFAILLTTVMFAVMLVRNYWK